MGYSLDPILDGCYPGTTVLINKLDIRDEATLDEAETLATYINASKLEEHPLAGAFDFSHYRAIHHFLFSDLYDWAGQIRTVNISKKARPFAPLRKSGGRRGWCSSDWRIVISFEACPTPPLWMKSWTFTV